MFELATWSLTVLAIYGVVANIRHQRVCFLVWIVTNICWSIVDASRGIYAQATLHVVYLGLSVWGWFKWADKVQVSGSEHKRSIHGLSTEPANHAPSHKIVAGEASPADGLRAMDGRQ